MYPFKYPIRRFLRDDYGGATFEGCIWLPVLLAFFFTSFDAAHIFLRDGEIQRVVQESARQYVKGRYGNSTSDAEVWIEQQLSQLAPNAQATVTIDGASDLLTATVTYPASDTEIGGWISALTNMNLTVQSIHQLEV